MCPPVGVSPIYIYSLRAHASAELAKMEAPSQHSRGVKRQPASILSEVAEKCLTPLVLTLE